MGQSRHARGVAEVLRVSRTCEIPLEEIEWRFETSGGRGGQHANRARTRVEVSFDIASSPSLGSGDKARLRSQLGDIVRAAASDERSQARNRAIALERLQSRLASALSEERPRRPTSPSPASRQRRLRDKRRRSELKRSREQPSPDDTGSPP